MAETQEQKHAALKRMADRLATGGRIVIGADEPVPAGVTVLQDGERHLVVKRRATRQEFLETAPGDSSHIRAAFYYELELWDRVVEREGRRTVGNSDPAGGRMIDEPCWDVNTEKLRCLIVLDDGTTRGKSSE